LKVFGKIDKIQILKKPYEFLPIHPRRATIPICYHNWQLVQGIQIHHHKQILGFEYCKSKNFDSSFVLLSDFSFARVLVFLTDGKILKAEILPFINPKEVMPDF